MDVNGRDRREQDSRAGREEDCRVQDMTDQDRKGQDKIEQNMRE